jgi:SAM-dependent methyltransferase
MIHWWFIGRRRILLALLDGLRLSQNDLIVDVGCGTGGNTSFIANNYNCFGIDPSSIAIEFARRLYPDTRFVEGTFPDAMTKDIGRPTVYLLLDILEHIEEDQQFLSSVIEHAQPGSYIIITVPAKKNLWSKHDEIAHHLRRYEIDELQKVWKGMPVSCQLLTSMNTRLYRLVQIIRMLNKRLGITVGRDKAGTDLDVPFKPINYFLAKIFGGEAKSILQRFNKSENHYGPLGVSLLAILKKHEMANN